MEPLNWMEVFGLTRAAPVGLHAYLIVAAALFVLGLIACMTRRNAIRILIGIELMLNAAILNFMAFWFFAGDVTTGPDAMSGPVMAVFVIVLAACEAAVALAILLNLYLNLGTVEVDLVHGMKH